MNKKNIVLGVTAGVVSAVAGIMIRKKTTRQKKRKYLSRIDEIVDGLIDDGNINTMLDELIFSKECRMLIKALLLTQMELFDADCPDLGGLSDDLYYLDICENGRRAKELVGDLCTLLEDEDEDSFAAELLRDLLQKANDRQIMEVIHYSYAAITNRQNLGH